MMEFPFLASYRTHISIMLFRRKELSAIKKLEEGGPGLLSELCIVYDLSLVRRSDGADQDLLRRGRIECRR